jgi:putative SOS response-associated peptidase YedK
MCNLYNLTTNQETVRRLFRVDRDVLGNLQPSLDVYPDYPAPIVRQAADGGRELAAARWGLPTPAHRLKNRRTDPGLTNVRHPEFPHWSRWLGPENRCLVPFTAFAESERRQEHGKSITVWFALGEDRPLACFAGIWVPRWKSVRKLKEGEVTADVVGFLTCDPSAEVRAIHPKAMPVILTTEAEFDTWLSAPPADALALQRPLPDGSLRIVGRDERPDVAPRQMRLL